MAIEERGEEDRGWKTYEGVERKRSLGRFLSKLLDLAETSVQRVASFKSAVALRYFRRRTTTNLVATLNNFPLYELSFRCCFGMYYIVPRACSFVNRMRNRGFSHVHAKRDPASELRAYPA